VSAVPPWCRLIRRPALIAVALTAGLAAVPATGGGPPAAAAVAGTAAAVAGTAAPSASRYNVGATHSPQLLSQLAGPSGPRAMTGSGQASALLAPAAAVAGDEQGVDVASFQHPKTTQYPAGAPIDWTAVAASGIGFAAVKVTEGTYYSNPFAATDLAQAQAAGLAVVGYGFAIPNGTGGSRNPADQADYLLNQLGTASRTVPVMLDIEYNPYAGGECYGLRGAPMISWVAGFAAEIKARTGRLPIIYTPPAWWNYCTGGSTTFGPTPLWVPDFSTTSSPARPAGWGSWSLWQYTSTGTVNGIATSGGTDLDQANPASLALLNSGSRPQANGDPVNLPLSLAVPPPGCPSAPPG
jgi:GH25 family lysozyme M1 (1,4-beta-N-acetylmuramidase)